MFPESFEVKWLPVNQKFSILDNHSPHAERLLICIDTLPMLPQFLTRKYMNRYAAAAMRLAFRW